MSAQYTINKKVANILSMSYGECEEGLGTVGNQFMRRWAGDQGGVEFFNGREGRWSRNLFLSDGQNNVVREVMAATGNISTVAGVPYANGGGKEDVPSAGATTVKFAGCNYVSTDTSGNLFITDVKGARVDKLYGAAPPLPLNHWGVPGGPMIVHPA